MPSGASTGIYEALELRDKDNHRFLGKGVLKAVANIHDIIRPKLIGMDVTHQEQIDKFMVETLDGSQNEVNLIYILIIVIFGLIKLHV